MVQITFVVNTFGRSITQIEPILNVLNNHQSIHSKSMVVDQNTPSLDLLPFKNIEVLKFPDRRISSARNKAVSATNSIWIVFLDDDASTTSEMLKKVEEALIGKLSSFDVIGGAVYILNKQELYSSRQKIKSGMIGFLNLKSIMGGFLMVKKNVFLELGGFSQDFGIGAQWGSAEESDYCLKAYFNQKKLYFSSELFVTHPPSMIMSSEKVYHYGEGKGALIKKWLFGHKRLLVGIEFLDALFVPLLQAGGALLQFNKTFFNLALAKLKGRISGFQKFKNK